MNITLYDRNKALYSAFIARFGDCKNVTVLHVAFDELKPHDAVIAPGNSFAIMTGGLDLVIRDACGIELQDYFQDAILHSRAVLSPGQAVISYPLKGKHKYVIYAPTMLAPQEANELDVCYAMTAALVLAHKNGCNDVAIPGLGTGTGMLQPETAATAMRAGYEAARYLLAEYAK